MALTASKSSGAAGRISTVVPSASSAYTWPVSCAMLIGVSPFRGKLSSQSQKSGPMARGVLVRVAEAVAHGHHALDVPGPMHDLAAEGGGLRAGRRIKPAQLGSGRISMAPQGHS